MIAPTRDTDPATAALDTAIAEACGRIAPLWPLKHFVAVNPFLGFADRTFHATCAMMHRVARVDMLMPRDFYARALALGEIEDRDLERALAASPADWVVPRTVAALRSTLDALEPQQAKHAAHVATVAEVLDHLAGGDRNTSLVAFMVDEISKWCAAYFDDGASAWRLPARDLAPYAAWRSAMRHDRNPEVMGIRGFRAIVATLPSDPIETIHAIIERLRVPPRAVADYLYQALLDVSGWASYARYQVWNSELYGKPDATLRELLAIRIAWGYALFVQRDDPTFVAAWDVAMRDAAVIPLDDRLGDDPELCLKLVLHEAYERAYQRRLIAKLSLASRAPTPVQTRKAVQAAFCIDVRSEVFRRAFERVTPEVATIGFAGFFGYPIEYVPIGHVRGGAQCPVLLTPKFTVCEALEGDTPDEEERIFTLRRLRRRVAKAWKSFKISAVSSFIYVETAGLLYAGNLLGDNLRLTRTVNDPNTDGLDRASIGRLEPRIEAGELDGRQTGFTAEQKLMMAEGVLRAMSLTENFARIVLMVGHGSTTVNNPHATGLDCGACGGHTGEANARLAAMILNHTDVRLGLRARGIDIPADTWFIGCLHDTTIDVITMYDGAGVPESHRQERDTLRAWLKAAGSLARAERAPALGLPSDDALEEAIVARSRDWSQVRPEWGLAGNAAFIAAPRERTREIDLGGRAFLHDYDWRKDDGFGILELIMTAPMVVASWINLQYYGSTVNNRVFGSGNKVLHNVTGVLGVIEGNAGDLRAGLPWQSVHDGTKFVHEPLRLSVFIAAPVNAMNDIIAKHESVRNLLDNRWLSLFAIEEDGQVVRHYERALRWTEIEPPVA